ncbi:putative inactive purple acid phosphatase 16 isoform X2 [Curcuma longa]|uniref:putative inactive purple acid phosphatase 16 isoform X2 n=1 Tax=Curcuma longa TaxID=136217 RepID=UPI003D9EC8AE
MDRAHCVALVLLVLLFVCVVVVITLVVLSSRRQDPFDPLPNTKPLRFSADGSPFKIALFADLHYGENAWTDWGPAQDDNSDRVMSAVIDAEDPDFVIYLGDVITANNLPIPNASLYWDRALSLTRNKWKPWSTVLGNHDDALFEWPSEWFSATGIPQVNCPKTNVPFSDSGGGSYPEVVSKAQAKWFKRQSKRINPNASIPEVIFWHIPSRAYQKVAPVTTMQIHAPCVGSINKEKVAPQKAEWGIMDILVSRASVKAVFAGHNHGLDWCCPHKSLWLCFARHTGYGGYGNWSRGSRIISIVEQPFSITSWIRMEDGTEHSRVVLAP